jgi:hypothetical protein
VSLDYKSLCRDTDGEPPDHHDSVRTPIGDNVEFVLCVSPCHTAAPPAEEALPNTTPLSWESTQKQCDSVRKQGRGRNRWSRCRRRRTCPRLCT